MPIDLVAALPDLTQKAQDAIRNAPRTLLDVNAAIDYSASLEVTDPRYVATADARAEKFEQEFFSRFGYDRTRNQFVPLTKRHVLFFGHVGCGKSTELTRLCEHLHNPSRYWVVKVDLLTLLDPNNANYSDVWLSVAQRLFEQLQEDGIAIRDIALKRLQKWFTEQVLTDEAVRDFSADLKTEAEAGSGIPFVVKLLSRFTAQIRTGSTYRDTVRTVVRKTYSEFIAALNGLIVATTEAVQKQNKGRCILFAIDGTDRFRGEDWKQFFVDDANQLTLVNCVAVYTAPMALKASGERLDMFESLVLPMIKLREFEEPGARREAAYRAMREMVLKRCHPDLFDGLPALDALITFSGGHLRDALRLLFNASIEGIDTNIIDSAVVGVSARRLANDYRDSLEASHYQVLAQAALDPENTGTSEAITRLVERGALLEYNTGSWRLPHPVVKLLSGYVRAEQALRHDD
jgi:hypothetical protein